MMPRSTLPIVAALTLAMSVSAHAATIQITMENLVIAPAQATAKVGDTIEWINKDVLAHTATARNGEWDVMLPPKKNGKNSAAGPFVNCSRRVPSISSQVRPLR